MPCCPEEVSGGEEVSAKGEGGVMRAWRTGRKWRAAYLFVLENAKMPALFKHCFAAWNGGEGHHIGCLSCPTPNKKEPAELSHNTMHAYKDTEWQGKEETEQAVREEESMRACLSVREEGERRGEEGGLLLG